MFFSLQLSERLGLSEVWEVKLLSVWGLLLIYWPLCDVTFNLSLRPVLSAHPLWQERHKLQIRLEESGPNLHITPSRQLPAADAWTRILTPCLFVIVTPGFPFYLFSWRWWDVSISSSSFFWVSLINFEKNTGEFDPASPPYELFDILFLSFMSEHFSCRLSTFLSSLCMLFCRNYIYPTLFDLFLSQNVAPWFYLHFPFFNSL